MSLKDAEAIHRKIFHGKTYLYAIPGIHRYSKEYNQTVGHLSTGSKVEDARVMNEYVNVGGTIIDILRLFEKGADIKFRDVKDLVDIYDTLVAHLNNWVYYIDHDLNVKNAPIEDLLLMAEFCETIKPQVIGFKPKAEEVPELARMKALFGLSGAAEALFSDTNVGSNVTEATPIVNRIEELLAQRNKKR